MVRIGPKRWMTYLLRFLLRCPPVDLQVETLRRTAAWGEVKGAALGKSSLPWALGASLGV
jgi:hypothetical protein